MLKTAAIFKNGMILQRNSRVSVFGWTDCTYIEVVFNDRIYKADISGSEWTVGINTAEAGENLEMIIIGKSDEEGNVSDKMEICDIMLGEVWLAGGQSNMELELQNSMNAEDYLKKADYDKIRFYNVPKYPVVDEGLYECEDRATWRKVKGDLCRDMSAVAYHFAVKLYETLKVPIGIIDCYWGGTSATCWVTEDALKDVTQARAYLDEWKKICQEKSDDEYDRELDSFNKEFNGWLEKVDEIKKSQPGIDGSLINEIAGPCPWPPPRGKKAPFRPYGLHESMVKRIAPYGIKGAVYYQAEEDGERADYYCKLNTAVVKQWRKDFNNDRLPFFITMLPMYIAKDAEDDKSWALLRSQQEKCSLENDNVGIAVITDCGEYDNIHPIDKKTPGKRLAEQVLTEVYEQDLCRKNLRAVRAVFDGNKCMVNLENTYGGLCYGITDGVQLTADREIIELNSENANEAAFGFEAVSGNNSFKPDILIKDGQLILSGKDEISEVRYAWFNYGIANVYGRTGMPLMPFRFTRG